MLVNFNRAYISTSHILIIPKSDVAAINSEQIIENLSLVPSTLSFYDRMISGNEFDDLVSELSKQKRKDYWKSKLRIKRVSQSGILEISALDKTRYQAEITNHSTVQTLIKYIGFYYDIKNDVDLRIIDGPITKETSANSNIFLFSLSLISGFILTFVLLFFSSYFSEKKKGIEKIRSDIFNFKKNFPRKEKNMEDLNKIILQEEEEKPLDFLEKEPIFQIKKASAPANLPIAPEEEKIEEKKEIKKEKNTPEPIIREATAEEVKERLNKLLSGEGM